MMSSTLLDALHSSSEAERRDAAEEIGGSHDPDAVAALTARLREEESRPVKEAMLRGLAHLSHSGPLDSIVELLKDDDPFVRAEAAEILQHRAEDAVDLLIGLMQGDDKDLRKFSIDILTASPHKTPDALFDAALADSDINVVLSTVENIGLSRRRSMEGAVLALAMNHGHPMIVCSCLETLALIGSNASLSTLRGRFPTVAEVPPLYLHTFLKVLGGTGTTDCLSEICDALKGKDQATLGIALDAMMKITSRSAAPQNAHVEETLSVLLAETSDVPLQRRIIRLLGRLAASESIAQRILPYFNHDDRLVAMAAMEALVNLPDPAIDEAIKAVLLTEGDPDLREELEDLLGRRPRWN